jgi:hypothetical protein
MNDRNQKALDATKTQKAVAYPNTVIDMTLNSRRKDDDENRQTFDPITNEVIDWNSLSKAEERELYSFVSRHAYIQDIIAGVITENKEYIDDTDADFYSITLTRQGVEHFGTDTAKSLNHDMWTNILYLAQHPTGLKSIPVKLTDDKKGRIVLTPYVIKLTYGEMEKSELQIRKDHDNAPEQKIIEVRIMFAKYLYQELYEQGQNFTKLGRCLFAKIKWLLNYYEQTTDEHGNELEKNDLNRFKKLLTEEEIKRFTKWGENPLQPIQIYKAVLYFARHDNSITPSGTFDAVDFCNSVEPSVLKREIVPITDETQKDENGDSVIIGKKPHYYFKESYYKEKLKLDIYTRIFNILNNLNEITGMKFTSCKAYLDVEKMKIYVNYGRKDK